MTAVSTTFQLSVVAPAQTVVGAIAQEMAAARPTGAMWSTELSTESSRYLAASHPLRPASSRLVNEPMNRSGGGYQAFTTLTDPAGTGFPPMRGFNLSSTQLLMGKAGPYSTHWDADFGGNGVGAFFLCNGTTGRYAPSMTLTRYDSATDEFRCWSGPYYSGVQGSASDLQALWPNHGEAHNFGGTAIVPPTRRLYRVVTKSSPSGQPYYLAWVSLDDPTIRGVHPEQLPSGFDKCIIEYFPEMGAAGSLVLMVRNPGPDQATYRLDIATDSLTGLAPNGSTLAARQVTYMPAVCYCNGALYFSAQNPGNQWERLNADGTLTTSLPPTPVEMNEAAQWMDGDDPPEYLLQQGRHTEMAALGTKIYAFYPGELNTVGAVYCYDTVAEAWSEVDTMVPWDTSQVPVADQGTTNSHAFRHGFTVAPIPSLGVVFVAQQWDTYETRAYLWKPPA